MKCTPWKFNSISAAMALGATLAGGTAMASGGAPAWRTFVSHCLTPVGAVTAPLTDGLKQGAAPEWAAVVDGVPETMFVDLKGQFAMTTSGEIASEPVTCQIMVHPEFTARSLLASLDWEAEVIAEGTYVKLEASPLASPTATGLESNEWREPRIWVTTDFGPGGVLILTVEETQLEI